MTFVMPSIHSLIVTGASGPPMSGNGAVNNKELKFQGKVTLTSPDPTRVKQTIVSPGRS